MKVVLPLIEYLTVSLMKNNMRQITVIFMRLNYKLIQ